MVEHRAPLTGGSTFSIFDTPSMARRMQNMALNGHSDNRENGDVSFNPLKLDPDVEYFFSMNPRKTSNEACVCGEY